MGKEKARQLGESCSPIGLDPLPLPVESGVKLSLGPFSAPPPHPRQASLPLWASAPPSETEQLWWGGECLPAPSSSGLGDPGSFPLRGLSVRSRPLGDPGGAGRRGRGDHWTTRAEGSGLPEPRRHTCVQNFLSSLLRACLLPSLPPAFLFWAVISLDGEQQTHLGGRLCGEQLGLGIIWGFCYLPAACRPI